MSGGCLPRASFDLSRLLCAVSATVACAGSGPGLPKSAAPAGSAQPAGPTLLVQGRRFARVGDLTRAAQYLQAATGRGAREREVLPTLLEVYIRSGRYRLAIAHGEHRLTAQPQDTRLRFLVGTLRAAVGDYSRAADHFEVLLSRLPSHAAAHYALAVLLRDHQADAVAAEWHFRRYLQLQPSGPHAAEARASLLAEVP